LWDWLRWWWIERSGMGYRVGEKKVLKWTFQRVVDRGGGECVERGKLLERALVGTLVSI